MTSTPEPSGSLSLVIPIHNEVEAILVVAAEIGRCLGSLSEPWDVIWIDDGSTDGSREVLMSLSKPHRVVCLDRHVGQSAAIRAGAERSHSDWLGIIDGDGQADPADILRQLAVARRDGCDLVGGIRARRADHAIRRLSSWIANGVRSFVIGNTVRDAGCSTKVIRRSCLLALPFFHGMQCFLPELVAAQGGRYTEMIVHHRPRLGGRAKYGIANRLFAGIRDLMGVRWLLSGV